MIYGYAIFDLKNFIDTINILCRVEANIEDR